MNTPEPEGSRKPYRKPQIQQVQLRIKDAVLGTGCKTSVVTTAPLINDNILCTEFGSSCLGRGTLGS
jgi:hypothetical protein